MMLSRAGQSWPSVILILTISAGGSSLIWHVSTQGEKAVFNLQFIFTDSKWQRLEHSPLRS